MSTSLQGRVAIVTGASAGIGLAIAHELAAHGSSVLINARRADRLAEVAQEINTKFPGSVTSPSSPMCVPVAGDCAEHGTIDQMLNTAKRTFGKEADLIIVNAGRGLAGSVLTSDITKWEEMVRTNILGAASLIRASAKKMLSLVPDTQTGLSGSWREMPRDIIVIGSVVGRHVSPFSSMYGGTKFAVHGMVEGVRREIGPKGIRVTLIEPGFVVSEFQGVAGYADDWFATVLEKIGPALLPQDVARAIVTVASQPASVHISDLMIRPTRQDYP